MKIRNTTDMDTEMLRRITVWCCQQAELSSRQIREAWFRNRTGRSYSGRAYYMQRRIVVSTNPILDDKPYIGRMNRLDCVVTVTAHEVAHIAAFLRECKGARKTRRHGRGHGGSERVITAEEHRIYRIYNADRDKLIQQWTADRVTFRNELLDLSAACKGATLSIGGKEIGKVS